MTLIHLDRLGRLVEGTVLYLFNDYGTETFINIANTYPLGISEHGHRYGFGTEPEHAMELCNSKAIEWMFEGIRLSCYPSCLSRLQAVFAVDQTDVPRTIAKLGATPYLVCHEVSAERIEKRDMSLLTGDIASAYLNAHKYWQGQSSEQPLYEYLLQPPVKVLRKISYEDLSALVSV